jgi:hypothetical protein
MDNQIADAQVVEQPKERKITDLSIIELKSVAYDLIAELEQKNLMLKQVNDIIAQKTKSLAS